MPPSLSSIKYYYVIQFFLYIYSYLLLRSRIRYAAGIIIKTAARETSILIPVSLSLSTIFLHPGIFVSATGQLSVSANLVVGTGRSYPEKDDREETGGRRPAVAAQEKFSAGEPSTGGRMILVRLVR